MEEKNKIRGRKARSTGLRFENRVRKDLEEKGWIVSKWNNNVKFKEENSKEVLGYWDIQKQGFVYGKIVPAKRKYNPYNKALTIGTGFPDFIAVRMDFMDIPLPEGKGERIKIHDKIQLVEAKRNSYLNKEEKAKCKFLEEKGFDVFVAYEGKDKKDKRKTLVKYKKWNERK